MPDTPGPAAGPDWHRPGSYEETPAFSRRAWAWEFLRRTRAYRQPWSDAAPHAVIETPAPGLVVVTPGAELAGLSRGGVFFQRCYFTGPRRTPRLVRSCPLPPRPAVYCPPARPL